MLPEMLKVWFSLILNGGKWSDLIDNCLVGSDDGAVDSRSANGLGNVLSWFSAVCLDFDLPFVPPFTANCFIFHFI